MAAIPATLMALNGRLEALRGQHISAICPNGYVDDGHNHCAHFVSHVMGYTFGYTCGAATGKSGATANLRVHEVFSRCQTVGVFNARPNSTVECLVFVTHASDVNVAGKLMNNVPKKHIGIYSLGRVYHYSNARHQVWMEEPDEFRRHYPGTGFEMYYGTFPL